MIALGECGGGRAGILKTKGQNAMWWWYGAQKRIVLRRMWWWCGNSKNKVAKGDVVVRMRQTPTLKLLLVSLNPVVYDPKPWTIPILAFSVKQKSRYS